MIAIIGLGNPGEKYQNNRHNVGFQFIDYIASLLHCSIAKKQFNNVTIQQCNSDILLVKPLTFMNKSGEAVKKLIENFKLKIENLVVAHDDLDIPLGKFKIQKGTGPQLHNGIESIEKYLKTKDFWRIRIGVDARVPENWVDGETYVLQNFRQEELDIIRTVFHEIIKRIQTQFPFLAFSIKDK